MDATPLPLLYADEALAVVDKPAGLMLHASPMARGERDFLLDRLRRQLGRPVHAAHRLDRATSGCVLLAFDPAVAAALGAQFMARTVAKTYLAVCRGWPEEDVVVDHPLDGGPGKPERKPALTRFRRLATAELPIAVPPHATARYALVQGAPETGRWRQIRRHLKHVDHHLIGDTSHGDGRHNRVFRQHLGVHRMLLHAWTLTFVHPHEGRPVTVEAPLDAAFRRALAQLGWDSPRP